MRGRIESRARVSSAGTYVTVGSDFAKLSVKAIGEMLDWSVSRSVSRVETLLQGTQGLKVTLNKSRQFLRC